jgi:hypothetical protein
MRWHLAAVALAWLSSALAVNIATPGACYGEFPVAFIEQRREYSAPRQPRGKYYLRAESFEPAKSEVEILSIANAVMDESAIAYISQLKSLKSIALVDVNVGDAGLALLLVGKHVQGLNISGSDITDISVNTLAHAVTLQDLYIDNTAMTFDGLRALKALRPDLRIHGPR